MGPWSIRVQPQWLHLRRRLMTTWLHAATSASGRHTRLPTNEPSQLTRAVWSQPRALGAVQTHGAPPAPVVVPRRADSTPRRIALRANGWRAVRRPIRLNDSRTVCGWRLSYVTRASTSSTTPQGDFYAVSPDGQRHRSIKSIRAYFVSRPAAASATSSDLSIGQRVRVYWTGDKAHYAGTVMRTMMQDGTRIHQIKYDDKQTCWHDMATEQWTVIESQDSPTVPAPSAAQVALATIARNRAVHASRQRDTRARILAERDLALVAFLWDSEFGDQFDVCPASHFEDL